MIDTNYHVNGYAEIEYQLPEYGTSDKGALIATQNAPKPYRH